MNPPTAPQSLSPEAARHLLEELGTWLRGRLRVPTKTLFDTLDDSLFELAEHSTSSERQQQYFDGMRECRRRREEIERDFLARIGRAEPLPRPQAQVGAGDERLSLVGHEELEENLAVTGLVARTKQRLQSVLYALDQRVGHLLGEPDLDEDSNPFGPARLAATFRRAASDLDVSLEVRLIMFKLFERHVLGGIEPVYSDINLRLANAGILPTLQPRVRRDPAKPAPATPSEPVAAEHEEGSGSAPAPTPAPEAGDGVGALVEELLNLLQSRLPEAGQQAGRGTGAATQAPAPKHGVPTPSTGQAPAATDPGVLLQALERASRRMEEGIAPPPPRQLAAQLQAEARYSGDPGAPSQLAAVDLVGRLFDVLLRSPQVPRPLQPMLQRMQVPMTRVALRDPSALTRPGHPAQQLMGLLGQAMIGWCRSADPEGRALAELESVIKAFSREDSSQEQTRIIEEWRATMEAQQRRAELAEQRTVESAAGRERLWHARRQVHQAIASRLAQTPLPAWVRHLLTHPWANCLVLLWLRQGEDSATYREAMGFADALLWCARAGNTDVERLRLRALLPVLESQLRQGLATVAYHDVEIEQLIGELREFMRWRLGEVGEPAFLEHEPPVAAGVGPGPDITEEQPLPEDLDQQLLARIRSVSPGAWFEFGPEQTDSFERAKLSWVSPYSGRCLFVNRNGMRVADRRPEELAKDMEIGMARMIEGVNLLQGALMRVLAQLRSDADSEGTRSTSH